MGKGNRANRRAKQAGVKRNKKRAEGELKDLLGRSVEDRPWTPFQPATQIKYQSEEHKKLAQEVFKAKENMGTCYVNSRYQVWFREVPSEDGAGLKLIHLSFKRHDNAPIRDWRDVQRIKNELCGPECEGVELYPAESRRMDSANQYHLWVFEAGFKFPFGFADRLVVTEDSEEATHKQRPIEEGETAGKTVSESGMKARIAEVAS